MACEAQYKTYVATPTPTNKAIYDDCLNRSDKAASDAQKTALYAQIHQTSAQLAQSSLPSSAPNYMQYLQSGVQYSAPSGPGFISRTTSGIGQGILIFGILGGGMLMMMLLFFMVKPATVSQIPGIVRKKSKRR